MTIVHVDSDYIADLAEIPGEDLCHVDVACPDASPVLRRVRVRDLAEIPGEDLCPTCT